MGKRCLQSQAQRAGTKISPARKGWVHSQAVERRRCGTTLFRLFIKNEADQYRAGPVLWRNCTFTQSQTNAHFAPVQTL